LSDGRISAAETVKITTNSPTSCHICDRLWVFGGAFWRPRVSIVVMADRSHDGAPAHAGVTGFARSQSSTSSAWLPGGKTG